MTTQPQTKAELMPLIEREWTALEEAIGRLSEAQMTWPDAGGWSPKDNLAHITAWERVMLRYHLQGRPFEDAAGVDEGTAAALGEDGLNAMFFERNKDRTPAEVLADFRQTHREVLAALEGLSDADLAKPRYADDPEARPVMNWVTGNTYEHYAEHRPRIDVGRKGQ